MRVVLLLVVLLLWLAAWAASARWAYRDAERRGWSGLRALALVSLLWPAGPFLWLAIRSGTRLALEGWESAWG